MPCDVRASPPDCPSRPRLTFTEPALLSALDAVGVGAQPILHAACELRVTGRYPIHLPRQCGFAADFPARPLERLALETVRDDRARASAREQLRKRLVRLHNHELPIGEVAARPNFEHPTMIYRHSFGLLVAQHARATARHRAREVAEHPACGLPGHAAHGHIELVVVELTL